MRNSLILICFCVLFASCSILHKKGGETELKDDKTQETVKQSKKEEAKSTKTLSEKEIKKQKEKEMKDKRKAQIAEQKRLNKEYEKKKKAEAKAQKQKEKEQEDIIKNAAKVERQRIKEERKAEKQTLLSSQKLAEQDLKDRERLEKEQQKQEEKRLQAEKKAEKQQAKQGTENKQADVNAESNTSTESLAVTQEVETQEQVVRFEDMSTMDQIVYKMKHPESEQQSKENTTTVPGKTTQADSKNYDNSDGEVSQSLTDKEKKVIMASRDEKKEGNFITRTYRKVFPEKVEREVSYPKMYTEKPLTLMVLYPYNRSQYKQASDMAYVSCVKEIGEKGYYVLPSISFAEEFTKDSLLWTKNAGVESIKQCREKYNADAVMLITVYRVEKPWWSTNINVVAHYDLISTKTGDTLFSRHSDFNYDTPIPTKQSKNDKLIKDPETAMYLGLFEQMQRYSLLDLPVGPYHVNYDIDRKKNSQKQEMKYKVNVKPS